MASNPTPDADADARTPADMVAEIDRDLANDADELYQALDGLMLTARRLRDGIPEEDDIENGTHGNLGDLGDHVDWMQQTVSDIERATRHVDGLLEEREHYAAEAADE